MISDIAFSAIRISTPLIFAALGGLFTFQAGMLNIALDGFMIVAAFAAIAAAYISGSLAVGVLAGILAGMLMAALMALFNLRFRAHIFIVGIAVTFLAYGLTALLLKSLLGQDGVFASDAIPTFPAIDIPFVADIPVVGPLASGHTLLVYVAYLAIPVVHWWLYRTRWGLRVRVVGEAEDAARAAGIPVERVKFQTMLLSGLFCGLAGAYLSLGYVSLFAKQMNNDRGLIALAAIFFAKGRPVRTAAVAVLFGLATALSVRLPQVTGAAPQLLELIPYLVTILAMVIVGIRTTRDNALNGSWRFDQ
ncbi:ABC transporter permease [Labrys monachus]|uniref:Simple sugar transport system permease protein n=1 Tax=Labrys monachus TaxID=217067 RepID=A0ABU0FM65_9HYPH|nr:ABC transporter permease [Labrys monachus]MDQ0395693.1 simple sugar transport system permease protein [Labrys monachus]